MAPNNRIMYENIPAELRALPQWVAAGSDKIPINPRTGQKADPSNPATGGTFAEAVHVGMKHIGFILGKNDPYSVIDLDDPFERNLKGVKSKILPTDADYQEAKERADRHTEIYNSFNTYAEESQSGRGVHLVMRGAIPCGVRRDKVEIYSSERYIIFTGKVLRPAPIADCQPLLDSMFSQIGKLTDEAGELIEEEPIVEDAKIWDMARRASNAEKFIDLCEGHWAKYPIYPSQSEADHALLSMLAFYTRSNEQVRRMFRQTKLGMREKATRNDVYINRSLKRIRARECPLVDISSISRISEPMVPEVEESQQSPFPIDALGNTLGAMCRAICDSERVPGSLAGPVLLGMASAAIGRGLQVERAPGKFTRSNVFLLIGAVSGSGKSEVFRHAERPISVIENSNFEYWQEHIVPKARGEKALLENEHAKIKSKAGKTDNDSTRQEAIERMARIEARLEELERALLAPRISTEDFTSERLATMLAENREQLAVLSPDAVGVISNLMGRYLSNGAKGATDEGVWLKGFSGESHRVDRMGRPSVRLINPCLMALMLTQPDQVARILESERLKDGGFLARFLIAQSGAEPQEILGDTQTVPLEIAAAYNGLITALLETFHKREGIATIQPMPEAIDALNGFHNESVRRRRGGGDLQDVQPFAARWGEQAWRVAVVLHGTEHGESAEAVTLSLSTAQRAIDIVRWFAEQQLEVLAAGRERARQAKQNAVLKLLSNAKAGITARHVYRARITPATKEAQELLSAMERDGLIAGESYTPPGGGKESRIYRPAK